MNSRKNVNLGDICDTISQTYKTKGEEVVLINTSDVLDGKVLNHSFEPNSNLKGQFKKCFQRDDILYSEIRPKNKRFAFVDFNAKNYIASTKLMVIRGRTDKVLPSFLFQVLKSDVVINELQILAETRSGTFPQITFSELAKIKIMLPSLDEQKEIAILLTCFDDKIDLNKRINDNLEQQANAVFKSWFIDFEPFGGIIPATWEKHTLDECCSLIAKGITPKYSDESTQTVINQKCIRDHRIDMSLTRTHLPKVINDKWLKYGDILINSTGTGTLGRAAQILFNPKDLTVDSHVTIIRPLSVELIYFLGLWCLSQESTFEKMATGSTGQTDLPRERLKAMPLIVPTTDVLKKFAEIIGTLFPLIIANQQENDRLAETRNALLPKLMSGEIDVSNINT